MTDKLTQAQKGKSKLAVQGFLFGTCVSLAACFILWLLARENTSMPYNHTRDILGHVLFYSFVFGVPLLIFFKGNRVKISVVTATSSYICTLLVGILWMTVLFKG